MSMKFGRPRQSEPEINLIPFIDVLLVVLIFAASLKSPASVETFS